MLLLLKLKWAVRAEQAQRRNEDPLAGEHAGWWLLCSKGTDNNRIVRAPGKKLQREVWAFRIVLKCLDFIPTAIKSCESPLCIYQYSAPPFFSIWEDCTSPFPLKSGVAIELLWSVKCECHASHPGRSLTHKPVPIILLLFKGPRDP